LSRSLVNPSVKHGTSNDNNNEESINSPIFRTNTFSAPTTTRTSATFTFPSYMEEPIIVYPGAIVCFLQIISCIPRLIDEQVKKNKYKHFFFLMNFLILVFKSFTIFFNVNIKKFIKI